MASRRAPAAPKVRHSLDALFRPRAVAVVGASRSPHSIGRQVIANLLADGFTGPIFPVNPNTRVVHSMKCYPSVRAIPDPVDLCVVVVPADAVLQVAEECGRKGVKGLVVVTAGFREIGGAGIAREQRLKAIAQRHGMRVIGPNCMGILNTEEAFRLNASFAAARPSPGHIGFVSQSGALGEAILAESRAEGLGVAQFASVGNLVDVTAEDLIEYWEDDPRVRLILLYIESVGDPVRFTRAARRVSRKKPILAVKAGRSPEGARAAGSHTGSVAGADVAADTLLAQCGVIRCGTLREMFMLAAALLTQPLPRGNRVAVVTNAGGPGILATDALISRDLKVPELGPATRQRLVKVLPAEATSRNPVDLIASADGPRYRKVLEAVCRDPGIDALAVLFVSPIMIDVQAVASAILAGTRGIKKPMVACVMGRHREEEAMATLRGRGVPVYRFPEEAARTLAGLWRAAELRAQPTGRSVKFRVARDAAAQLLRRAGGWLDPERVERVLRAYGLPLAPSRRVTTPAAAMETAHALGYPVVLKTSSARILHKSEVKGVVLGLKTGDEVLEAAQDLLARARRLDPRARLQVQCMVEGQREILLGMTRDPGYGPLFAVGMGGVLVEVLRDVAVRIGPLHDLDPDAMLRSLKGWPLLQGFRGDPPCDLRTAREALLRLNQLVEDFPRIAEVEINPFILGREGEPSFAVDARLRVE
jgi:acetyl coenzyme A synthetase (ADP forming)-like protein